MKTPSLVLFAFALTACGGHGHDHGTPAPAAGNPANAAAPKADDHGARHELGTLTVGAHTFTVAQEGAIEAGKEAAVELAVEKGKPLPSTVRVWIGVESGEGSMKQKCDKEGDHLHGHALAPKTIPAGAKIWIEVDENGASQRGSVAWK